MFLIEALSPAKVLVLKRDPRGSLCYHRDMNAENGQPSFSDEVKANMAPEPLLDVTESVLSTDAADIHVRQRGCFITECRLTSPTSNQQVEVLHADSDHRVA